jgi:galactose-1-phosphate uridylyltransferase
MEILWAPWRLNYVKKAGKEKTPCFICKAIEERDDEKNLLLHRGKLAVVILNRYPYNPGHLMVCPVRHTGDFTGLLEEELVEINKLIQRAIEEKERQRQALMDNQNYDPLDFMNPQNNPTSQGGKWYMYNPVLVSRGQAEFKKKWGSF